MSSANQSPYTVLIMPPDWQNAPNLREAYRIEYVRARTPSSAARAAIKKINRERYSGRGFVPDDYCALAVFAGQHEDVLEW